MRYRPMTVTQPLNQEETPQVNNRLVELERELKEARAILGCLAHIKISDVKLGTLAQLRLRARKALGL